MQPYSQQDYMHLPVDATVCAMQNDEVSRNEKLLREPLRTPKVSSMSDSSGLSDPRPDPLELLRVSHETTPTEGNTERNTRECTREDQSPVSRFLGQLMTIGYETLNNGAPGQQPTVIKTIGPWRLMRTIGSGSTSKVKLAVNRDTGERCAIKIVSRKKFQEQAKRGSREPAVLKERRVWREATVMYLLDHENILPLLDFHVTPNYYILFFEYVEGVQLLDFIISHGKLRERVARKFFRQLLSAVDYLHRHGVVHRDLKIENVVVEAPGRLRLLDFGLSNFYDGVKPLKTFCGSLYFAAPELLNAKPYRGPEIDMWSLGVILFVMCVGRVPFDDPSVSKLHERIKAGIIEYPAHLSPDLRALLGRLLVIDPSRRATITEAMNHPWVLRGYDGRVEYHATEPISKTPELDGRVVERVCELFAYEFDREAILKALGENTQVNPLASMYSLVQNVRPSGRDVVVRRHSVSELDEKPQEPMARPGRAMSLSVSREPQASHDTPITRPRSSSEGQKRNPSPLSEHDQVPLKQIFFRGMFSVNTTTSKSATALRRELLRVLDARHLRFHDHLTYFTVDCPSPPEDYRDGEPVKLEAHMVHLTLVGLNGVQFRRISGDICAYKTICSAILHDLRL